MPDEFQKIVGPVSPGEREPAPQLPLSWRGDARRAAHGKLPLRRRKPKTKEERNAEANLAINGPAARVTLRIKLPGHDRPSQAWRASLTTEASREAVKAALCDAVDRAFDSGTVRPWVRESA